MRRAWFAVLALTLAYVHANVARQIVPMFVGPIQADLGLSDVGISLVAGFAFALFYAIMGVPLGRLVDRADRRRLILVGMVVWAGMTALSGWATSLVLFLIGRIGLGISEAAVVPAALSMLNDLFPRHRLALAVNTFFTGAWLGNGLAFLVGAAVLAWAGTDGLVELPALGSYRAWQFAFLAVAAAAIPVLLVVAFVREPPRSPVPHAAGAMRAPERSALRTIADTFREQPRVFGGIFAGATLYSAVVSGAAFWAVEYLVRSFGSDRGHVSVLYGLQGCVAGSLGLIASGWLADRGDRGGTPDAKLRVGIASLVLLAPLGLCFPLVTSESWGIALYVLVTFLTPVAYGTCTSALQAVTPADRQGLITGLYTFATNAVGMGLGPTAIALATQHLAGGEAQLGRGIAIVMAVMLPLAIAALASTLAPYRALVRSRA